MIKKYVAYSTLNRLVFTIRGFLILPIITKFIGVADYGVWIYFVSITGLIVGVGGLHSQGILIRYFQENNELQSVINVLALSIFPAIILSSIFYMLSTKYEVIRLISNISYNNNILLPVSYLIFVRNIWKPIKAYPRAKEQIQNYEMLRAFRGLVETIVLTIVLFFTGSLAYGFWAVGSSYTTVCIFTYIKYIPKGIALPEVTKFPEFLNYGVPIMMSNIATESLKDADKYLIAYFLTANALGVYGIAYRVAQLLGSLTGVLKSTLYPAIVNAWDKGNSNKITEIYSVIFTFLIVLFPPAIIGIWSVSDPLFEMLTAETVPNYTQYLIIILAIGICIKATGDVVQYVLVASHETELITITAVVASIINIVLNVVLLTTIGLIGAAIATAVAYVIESSLYYYFSARHVSFDIRLDYLWRSTAAALCMGAILSQLSIPSPEIALVSKVLLGIALYGIIAFTLNGFTLPREAITFDT